MFREVAPDQGEESGRVGNEGSRSGDFPGWNIFVEMTALAADI